MVKRDKRKRIAIDVDGTLTKQGLFPNIYEITQDELAKIYEKAEPDLEMIRIVNEYHKKGHIIYIFTSRNDLHERITKKWLDKYGVKYDFMIMNKPYFSLYVCDSSVNVSDFKLINRVN